MGGHWTDRLEWSGKTLTVDGTTFLVTVFDAARSDSERFVVWKTRSLLEANLALLDDLGAQRIVELGIAEGGSTALLALVRSPQKLVAIDFAPDPVVPLDDFISRRGLGASVRPHYGVDQSDRARLLTIAHEEFGDEPIDVVLDDASHRLAETRASFNTLFPLLRPGGAYVVEDWAWGQAAVPAALRDSPDLGAWYPGGDPLTILAFEAAMASAHSSAVAAVHIDEHFVRITRGDGELDPLQFDLRHAYPTHAERLLVRGVDDAGAT